MVMLSACERAKEGIGGLIQFYVKRDDRNKLKWDLNQNTKLFIHENASGGVVTGVTAVLH